MLKQITLFSSLFNDVISSSNYVTSNDWMRVNNELEITWKEAVVA
jgi:hypothetical protein